MWAQLSWVKSWSSQRLLCWHFVVISYCAEAAQEPNQYRGQAMCSKTKAFTSAPLIKIGSLATQEQKPFKQWAQAMHLSLTLSACFSLVNTLAGMLHTLHIVASMFSIGDSSNPLSSSASWASKDSSSKSSSSSSSSTSLCGTCKAARKTADQLLHQRGVSTFNTGETLTRWWHDQRKREPSKWCLEQKQSSWTLRHIAFLFSFPIFRWRYCKAGERSLPWWFT